MKPLGRKVYGSIPHLPDSRLGLGDHHVTEGQARICLKKTRDKYDRIVIQEKLDGSCCAVALKNGVLLPLGRAGHLACSSPYPQHRLFDTWVWKHEDRFRSVLREGERVVGEWLARAHGTRYEIVDDLRVWRPFDIMVEAKRIPYDDFLTRITDMFHPPSTLHVGGPLSLDNAIMALGNHHTPVIEPDNPEGVVYRVHRHGKIDFLAKFVFHFHTPGKYFEVETWNWKSQ